MVSKKGSYDNEGISVVENLLALALVSIVISGFISIYCLAQYVYENQIAYSEMQYSARMAVYKIMQDVWMGRLCEVSPDGRQLTIAAVGDEFIKYYLENSQIYRHGKAKNPVAENVKEVSFSKDSNLITVKVVTVYKDDEYSLSFSCYSRIEGNGSEQVNDD